MYPGGVTITEQGLIIHRDLSAEEWVSLGLSLGRTRRATDWQLGDWWNASRHAVEEGTLLSLLEALGIDLKTLQNLGSLCKTFPLEERRLDLSLGHHQAVAGLEREVRRALLEQAAREGWSVAQLREEARRRRRGERREVEPLTPTAETGAREGAGTWREEEVPEPIPLEKGKQARHERDPGWRGVRRTEDGWESEAFPGIRVVERGGRLLIWNPMARYTPAEARALAEVLLEAAECLEERKVPA